jgi:Flp pilus assembly pilin Flp
VRELPHGRRPDRGATAATYAVMAAIVALLLVAAVWLLASRVGSTFSEGGECVADPAPAGCGPGSGGGGGGGGGGGTTTTSPSSTTSTTVP